MARQWSVKLALVGDEANAVSGSLSHALTPSFPLRKVGGFLDERPFAELSIEAETNDDARVRAQHWVGEQLKRAGLPLRQVDVVWVAPLRDRADDLRFLDQARELIDEDRHELAVLAAQAHLESQVGTLVAFAISKHPEPLRSALVDKQRSWSMMRPLDRAIVEASLDLSFKEFDDWKRYQTHVERRNDVAHRGQHVSEDDARDSLEIVERLWLWINQAANRRYS